MLRVEDVLPLQQCFDDEPRRLPLMHGVRRFRRVVPRQKWPARETTGRNSLVFPHAAGLCSSKVLAAAEMLSRKAKAAVPAA
jgi:hypothetical protein